jgi:hypothetical protein
MRGLKSHPVTFLLIALVVLLALCGACTWTPAETAQPVPPVPASIPAELHACLETYAGQWAVEGPMVSHPQARRTQTLALRRDWKATLTTEFPGSRHLPMVEAGAWRCDGARASVVLELANAQPERNLLTLERRGDDLVITRSTPARFAREGLKLRPQ